MNDLFTKLLTYPNRHLVDAKSYLLILFLFFLGAQLSAQEETSFSPQNEYLESTLEQRDIKENKWEKAIKGLDYTPPKVKERRARKTGNLPTGNSRTALTILAVVLIAIIVALSIAAWAGYLKSKPKKVKNLPISIEDIEENLFENDLQFLLQEAINKGEYKLAIRLYFLEILKELALQKKIKWKKEKTNRIYFYELNNSGLSQEFNQLVILFDRIRYGGVGLDHADFSAIAPDFKSFLGKLQKTRA